MRQVAAVAGMAVMLAVAAGAKDEWKKKPAGQWTQAEVEEFLRKSPWAKEVELWQFTGRTTRETVRERRETYSDAPGEAPVTVSSATQTVTPELVSAKYRVWWTSAGLARQAWERLRELNPALAEQDAPPEASPAHYIVTVRATVPPAEPTRPVFAGLSEPELLARATLRAGKKQTLAAERAVRHGSGAAESVSFYFPRELNGQATLAGAEWAEFEFESPLGDTLKHKFKLKEMQTGGKADY